MTPQVTVIIPSYNRRETLERVLAAYNRQRPATLRFEIIVVDDGSSDGTEAFLKEWRSERYAFRFESQENAGPAAARNRGMALAQGDLVMFTGDDIEPTPDLLNEHVQAHEQRSQQNGTAIILGLTRWAPGGTLTATMRHIDGVGAQQFSYQYLKDGAEYDFRHFYTSNVTLRRSLLEREAEGFSTDFRSAAFEDAELAYRLSQHGGRIIYHAAAEAYHHHPYGVAAFCRRQEKCGAMGAVLYRKHPQLEKWVGTHELGRLRLENLRRDVNGPIDDWERRAVQLAAFFDEIDPPPIDGILHALFRYSYLKGLAAALHNETAARRLRTGAFLDLVPDAVAGFQRGMAHLGLAYPAADATALAALASPEKAL